MIDFILCHAGNYGKAGPIEQIAFSLCFIFGFPATIGLFFLMTSRNKEDKG